MGNVSIAYQSKGSWVFCSWWYLQALEQCRHTRRSVDVEQMSKYTYAMVLFLETCRCHSVLLGRFRSELPMKGLGYRFLLFGCHT